MDVQQKFFKVEERDHLRNLLSQLPQTLQNSYTGMTRTHGANNSYRLVVLKTSHFCVSHPQQQTGYRKDTYLHGEFGEFRRTSLSADGLEEQVDERSGPHTKQQENITRTSKQKLYNYTLDPLPVLLFP